jgi:hypothetical protein
MIGKRLAHYEITSHLGSGGMGDVYQATDLKLGRSVALKMLPREFANDRERARRIEREARMLAALNHASIAAIYGIEDADSQPFFVMELVPGPTLADKLALGALPPPEALRIARHIATALEAAHERGVIHRDLKPANIKITPDGGVKLLDFGLAKAASNALAESAPTTTLGAEGSRLAGVVGTPAYMSPEQALGQAVDERADIWAFGAVLYEMLTGKRAFPGATSTETIASVIKTDPDWSALPELPPIVLAFLKQCLQKDPRQRMRSIADVRLALDGAYEMPIAAAPRAAPRASRRLAWALATLAIAAASVAAALYYDGGSTASTRPITVRQLTFRQGTLHQARFATDGQVIVYSAGWDGDPPRLFTTRFEGFQSRPIDLPAADLLSLSRDNELAISLARPAVDGFQPDGVLARVPLSGGAPRALDDNIVGVAYGPDGQIAALIRRVGLVAELEFPVGNVIYRSTAITGMRVSPDGQRICFGKDYGWLWAAELGGQPRQLIEQRLPRIARCAWTPDGREIWFSFSATGATHTRIDAIDPDTGSRRLVNAFTGWTELQDIRSDEATLVSTGNMRFAARGSAAPSQRERDLSVFDATRVAYLSASGEEVLLTDNSAGAQGGSVFLRKLDGSPAVQFGRMSPIAITPDGAWIAGVRFDKPNVLTLFPVGAGAEQDTELPVRIVNANATNLGTNVPEYRNADFSDDGRRLLIPAALEGDSRARVYVHDFEAGWTRPITPVGAPGFAALSPDGTRVAANERDGLFVYDVDSGERRAVPGGRDPGVPARWSTEPNAIFLLEYEGTSARLVRRDVVSGERTTVRSFRALDPAGVSRFEVYVSRDGQAYVYTLDRVLTNLFVVEGLQ